MMEAALKIQDILKLINEEFNVRGITPWSINNGYCSEWADKAFSKFEDTENITECWETIHGHSSTSHCFIRVNGMFYDAECLDGVYDHMDLPIFSKSLIVTGNREPVWLLDYSMNGYWGVDKFDATTEMIDQYNIDNNTYNA